MTRGPQLQSHLFHGHVDSFHNGTIRGWALNIQKPHTPAGIHVLMDGQEVMYGTCTLPRDDVRDALNLSTNIVGFDFQLPNNAFDGNEHLISLRFDDRTILPFTSPEDPEKFKNTLSFKSEPLTEYQSYIDGIRDDALTGWIIQRQLPDPNWKGNAIISVSADGIQLGTVRANIYRADVADAMGCEPNCGFEVIIPRHLYDKVPHEFHVIALPHKAHLNGSPFVSSLVNDELETRLVSLENAIISLHRDLTNIRKNVGTLIPRRSPNLQRYDSWAQNYRTLLTAKIDVLRRAHPLKHTPLISILCPTWRPNPKDFSAAIESVIHQTYSNWELIIVDDGSQSPETTHLIQKYCSQDKRIRALFHKKNKGISGATNTAIDNAKGDYIAFFDHDDLLADVALEVMIRAALTTGAQLLYSDEDKIDNAGHFLEPNFKPAYDYRYLLGCNYICHLTLIKTETARQIGPLNPEFDGAQDHDFLLRATEILPEEAIHHVPEILYHWRKTPNSTAANLANKTYAIEAGVKCVQAHLKRCKVKGKSSSINGLSLYQVKWSTRRKPSVSIIIPFRDHVTMTRQCVESLLTHINYRNYDIILVDNFSIEQDTLEWIESLKTHPKISILRVEEPFNFSRLNNLAVQKSKSDFVIFLNNDVIVQQKDFLDLMIQETLANPKVASVGARLLYPNGSIQHAGVAVGPDVIGVHIHRAQEGSAYGYIGRIKLTHHVTAVTGAAMLVERKAFNEVGGFDEEHLCIAYNDVDLCLRLQQHGRKIIYCAEATAEHRESFSRGSDDRIEKEDRFFKETQTMLERWKDFPLFKNDPRYPHYFRKDLQTFFDLREPQKLW